MFLKANQVIKLKNKKETDIYLLFKKRMRNEKWEMRNMWKQKFKSSHSFSS